MGGPNTDKTDQGTIIAAAILEPQKAFDCLNTIKDPRRRKKAEQMIRRFLEHNANLRSQGYKIEFQHGVEKIAIPFYRQGAEQTQTVDKHSTTCTIYKEEKPYAVATVRLHHDDQHNLTIARSHAFYKATEELAEDERKFLRKNSPIKIRFK